MRLWLTWSWRDLRRRPVPVIVIALVIALGTGLATGLASLQTWRVQANDASFALLRFHSLRVSLPDGGFAPAGSLDRAIGGVPGVAAAREQLVLPTQVDVVQRGRTILVPGLVVGQRIDMRPVVDGLAASRGRVLTRAEEGQPVAMLERSFAAARGLQVASELRMAGGASLRSVGWAFQPQYFLPASSGIGLGGEDSYAVVFTSLRTAQRVTDRPGQVNQLVVRARPGTTPAQIESGVRAAIARALPGVGVTFTQGTNEPAYRILYRDAEGDQKTWRILSLLVLAGAALAAYSLTSRTIQAERREIGIGMALGVPPRWLALRPVLMGVEIALLGVLFGVAIGLLLSRLFGRLLLNLLPLPVLQTPFLPGQFAAAAAVGLALPLLGVLLPVWKAVRMRPIDAIRLGFRAAGGGGLAPLLAKLRLPGDSLVQVPLRNIARAPRRTLATVAGIGIIVSLVVTFTGLIDSFTQPMSRARTEILRADPGRLIVTLAGFQTVNGATVRAIRQKPQVARIQVQDTLSVTLGHDHRSLDGQLTLLNPQGPGWRPSLREGRLEATTPGIVIAHQAAVDLGVRIGDTLVVRHPRITSTGRVNLVDSRVRIDAIHQGTLRQFAFASLATWAARTGLRGLTNQVVAVPARGTSADTVVRALFGAPGVTSVERAAAPLDAFDKGIERFLWFIYATDAFVLLLALLVAFNSAAISADERRREHATMFAYGVPRGTIVAQSVAENAIVGLLASIAGVGLGLLLVGWIVRSTIPQTVPDLELSVFVSPTTIVAAIAIGVLACALAPLLTSRRLGRMDIASTLRVME